MDYIPEQNLLTRLEAVSGAASKCGLDFRKLASVSNDIETVASFLGIGNTQAILFSVIADLSMQRTVSFDAMAKHIECSVLKLVSLMKEAEVLERKGYIKKSLKRKSRRPSYNDMGFTVPAYVIEALLREDASKLEAATRCDLPSFLKQVSDIVDERNENTLNTSQVCEEVQFLITSNSNLPFVFSIDSGLKSIISKCTVFAFSYVRLKGQTHVDFESFANAIFDDLGEQLEYCQKVASGRHELITKGYLKLVASEFSSDKSATLSQKTAKELFRSYPALLSPESDGQGVIPYRSVKAKKLWFSDELQQQLGLLEEVLQTSKFRAYRRELKRNGLSSGITAIFSGSPGTGKTEMVYQLARLTRRNIMMVDLSQARSKWFGESEKRVKQIFDDYSALLMNSTTEPILFINEADGLIAKRINLGISGTSSDHAINTIQNVLLQALENFEGILIATTNLTGNIDNAFERRFSFRIDFPKPDKQVRGKIWKDKLPELSEEEAALLGERFDIAGGEIDNQVRQVLLRKVLRKDGEVFEALMENCKKAHGFSEKKNLGFR